ncbi:SUN domain-containing protein 1-like [Opisthocomus hoazin]|uniref:SUN domain-containing protein 1-like n=1 Tax=Opisthocomus hoazin TaxID=30419 RepID=UPI003F52FEB0
METQTSLKGVFVTRGIFSSPQVTLLFMFQKPSCCSSSYSSSALDFETENKIDPVFDSPRMLRRSLRLSAAALKKSSDAPKDTHPDSSYAGNLSFREQSSKVLKHRPSVNKKSGSARHTPRKNLSRSSIVCQSSFNSHASDASIVSSALGESRIREQREVTNFWDLDDEGDPKGSDTTLMQGNGDTETAENSTVVNGYTCRDCSMLSERKEVLTAYSPSRVPSSRIYSRDRSQKHASTHSDYCGSMNVKEFYREDGHLGVNEGINMLLYA